MNGWEGVKRGGDRKGHWETIAGIQVSDDSLGTVETLETEEKEIYDVSGGMWQDRGSEVSKITPRGHLVGSVG